ncbi:hypothetical protein Tco_1286603, partial [Tanacetum coccineum]
KMECEAYYSLPEGPMRGLKYMNALVDQGPEVNGIPLSTYNRLTDEKLVETDIKLSLANIKEDRENPFILGMLFLTTAKTEIRFDKGTITLKSGKSKVNFHKFLEFLCKFEERKKMK